MTEFIAALIVFLLFMLAVAVGGMVRDVQVKSSCGGMKNLRKFMGYNPCDACTERSPDCPLSERH